MFDPIKLMGMLKKANDFKKNVEEQLRKIDVLSSVGEGLVEIQMNGLFEVKQIKIDKDVFYQKDVNFLEDLIKTGTNDATEKVKNTLIERVKSVASNISFFQ